MRVARHVALALLLLHGSLWSGPVAGASAQSQEVRLAAAAREFFAQGIAFADKSQWAEAADRFRRALSIRESSVIAFNLASSLEELGELVEASELLYGIDADTTADPALRQSARALLGDIKPRLASLTVTVANSRSQAQVLLDGLSLSPVQLGVAIPVDPGAHVVVYQRGDSVVQRDELQLSEGQAHVLTIGSARAPSPAEVAALAQQQREADSLADNDPPVTQRWWFWAGVGTILAGTVAAITIATLSGDNQRLPTGP